MYTPIIMPMPVNSEESKCPHCHATKDKKVVCRSCGYEYKETKTAWHIPILLTILAIVVVIVLLGTLNVLFDWLAGNDSLVSVISDNFHWLLSRRIF